MPLHIAIVLVSIANRIYSIKCDDNEYEYEKGQPSKDDDEGIPIEYEKGRTFAYDA